MKGTEVPNILVFIILVFIGTAALLWFLFTFSYGLLCPECKWVCYGMANIINNVFKIGIPGIFEWKPISVSEWCNWCGYC